MRVFFLLSLILLASCRLQEKTKDYTTLYLNLENDPITFNPIVAEDAYSNLINSKIHESLLKRDVKTLKWKPALAQRYEISRDHLVYTFFLKKNARFHDGHPVTADDVIYTFQKIMDPQTPNPFMKVYYQDVQSVEKRGSHTVIFRLKKPYFKSLEFLGGFEILPKHIFSKQADFVSNPYSLRHPIGAGPYKLKEWKTGQRIVLVRNEDYHGPKPEIRQYYYRIIKNEAVALQALKKREIDMLNLKPFQWTRQTNSQNFNRYFQKIKYISGGYRYIGYNTRRFPFTDKRVRRAITMLLDREKILASLMDNLGFEVTGPFHMAGNQYDKNLKPLPYDPVAAKKLLAEAGFQLGKDGILEKEGQKFIFELLIPAAAPFYEQFASVAREELLKAGIVMEIRKLEFQVLVEKANKRDFYALMMGWSVPLESDPYQVWHSSQIERGHNFTGFSRQDLDALIEKARVDFNEKRRNALYHKIQRIIYEEQPYTFLYTSYNLIALHRRFTEVEAYPAGLDPDRWKILYQWEF
ncbi:MAG: peptide-binding protein [Leptospiraceae bacterium]|nr:peptide-binding protein [Leptospiraceae bacterium]MDW8306133.1 peptide-binding protein [Leptospiraceae bacterium]